MSAARVATKALQASCRERCGCVDPGMFEAGVFEPGASQIALAQVSLFEVHITQDASIERAS